MKPKQERQTVPIVSVKGFTLIELLIAIVILSVGLLGMATLTGSIVRNNKLSNDLTTATTLAQDKLEDIRADGYASAVSETKTACATPFSEYQREVTVNNGTPAAGMKQITVKVYWASDAHDVEVKTILCPE
ncbi:MAG: prepilin-type N-terminal cleavage/methylation domain-containing protein [Deltaproteobacteria bacterium]|nr:prepilin-type N-terminal cleavage/methylation domain-containing protein [Deltaproteobacteria bacterium]